MKKILLYISLLILVAVPTVAQKLLIVRTDVDSLRKSFVTATLQFGFDIYIDNISSCNGVAFRLNFNREDVIKYSDYQSGDFGQPYVINSTDGAGNGELIVGVTTGTVNLPDSIKRPKVIHLEFVVLPTALNGDTSTFNFINPIATVNKAGVGSTISIGSIPIKFAIHGFVNVWPGDTDNNGIVNHLDFGPVSQYVGMGSATKNMKSFKRKSQSSIWSGHKCLVWDSAAVTFADCDGNGDVTISDMLIVTYNIAKDSAISKINSVGDSKLQSNYPIPQKYDKNLLRIPVRYSSDRAFIAATGRLVFNKKDLNVIGIENSDSFNKNEFVYFNLEENSIEFIVGSYSRELNSKKDGILCYLVCEQNNTFNNQDLLISDLRAIDDMGIIYHLNSYTSVDKELLKPSIMQANNQIIIKSNNEIDNLKTIDFFGNLVSNYSPKSQEFILDVSNYSNGIYFIQILSGKNNQLEKLIISR